MKLGDIKRDINEDTPQRLMRDCHEIAIRPGFGDRLTVQFRSYGHTATTLTIPAHAVTIYGDGRIEFHDAPKDPK